jgi:hypothetical protein
MFFGIVNNLFFACNQNEKIEKMDNVPSNTTVVELQSSVQRQTMEQVVDGESVERAYLVHTPSQKYLVMFAKSWKKTISKAHKKV